MRKRLPWRTFIAAFILTLCVLGLGGAFLLIEYNIQKTTYGGVDFGVTYTMEDGAPSVSIQEETVTVPPAVAQVCEAVLPPPVRLLIALWRGENDLAVTVLEWLK